MARASSPEQGLAPLSNNRAKRESVPNIEVWSWTAEPGSQEQGTAQQRCDEVDGDKGSSNKNRNREDLRCCDLRPLGRHVGSRASGLAKQKLAASWQAHARNLMKKSSHLGMEHPGAAGSGEVETPRGGDVVEAGAEAILK